MATLKQAEFIERMVTLAMKVGVLLFTMAGTAGCTAMFFHFLNQHDRIGADSVSGFCTAFFGAWFSYIAHQLFSQPAQKLPSPAVVLLQAQGGDKRIGPD